MSRTAGGCLKAVHLSVTVTFGVLQLKLLMPADHGTWYVIC